MLRTTNDPAQPSYPDYHTDLLHRSHTTSSAPHSTLPTLASPAPSLPHPCTHHQPHPASQRGSLLVTPVPGPESFQSIPLETATSTLTSTQCGLHVAPSVASSSCPAEHDREQETCKPLFHVMPRSGWGSDPNGPIFYKGRYHLFYQARPGTCQWHWGVGWDHVVSKDLAHWEKLPPAIFPTPGGPDADGCFSGSIVLEPHSGVPVCFYTGARLRTNREVPLPHPPPHLDMGLMQIESQCCAVCEPDDELLERWHKVPMPLMEVPHTGELLAWRDPWFVEQGDGKGREWTMLIGSGLRDAGGTALVYRTADITRGWRFQGELCSWPNRKMGVVWECPFLIQLQPLPLCAHVLPTTELSAALAATAAATATTVAAALPTPSAGIDDGVVAEEDERAVNGAMCFTAAGCGAAHAVVAVSDTATFAITTPTAAADVCGNDKFTTAVAPTNEMLRSSYSVDGGVSRVTIDKGNGIITSPEICVTAAAASADIIASAGENRHAQFCPIAKAMLDCIRIDGGCGGIVGGGNDAGDDGESGVDGEAGFCDPLPVSGTCFTSSTAIRSGPLGLDRTSYPAATSSLATEMLLTKSNTADASLVAEAVGGVNGGGDSARYAHVGSWQKSEVYETASAIEASAAQGPLLLPADTRGHPIQNDILLFSATDSSAATAAADRAVLQDLHSMIKQIMEAHRVRAAATAAAASDAAATFPSSPSPSPSPSPLATGTLHYHPGVVGHSVDPEPETELVPLPGHVTMRYHKAQPLLMPGASYSAAAVAAASAAASTLAAASASAQPCVDVSCAATADGGQDQYTAAAAAGIPETAATTITTTDTVANTTTTTTAATAATTALSTNTTPSPSSNNFHSTSPGGALTSAFTSTAHTPLSDTANPSSLCPPPPSTTLFPHPSPDNHHPPASDPQQQYTPLPPLHATVDSTSTYAFANSLPPSRRWLFGNAPDACFITSGLVGTRPIYWIGEYDSHNAKYDIEGAGDGAPLDIGNCLYAPICFQDDQGRHVLWGYMKEVRNVPPAPAMCNKYSYAGCVSLPRALYLKGDRLFQLPLPELTALRSDVAVHASRVELTHGSPWRLADVHGLHLDMEISVSPGSARQFVVLFRSWRPRGRGAAALVYDWTSRTLRVVFEAMHPSRRAHWGGEEEEAAARGQCGKEGEQEAAQGSQSSSGHHIHLHHDHHHLHIHHSHHLSAQQRQQRHEHHHHHHHHHQQQHYPQIITKAWTEIEAPFPDSDDEHWHAPTKSADGRPTHRSGDDDEPRAGKHDPRRHEEEARERAEELHATFREGVEDWLWMRRGEAGGVLDVPPGSPLRLRLFLDASCLEVFTGSGQVLTIRVYRGHPPQHIHTDPRVTAVGPDPGIELMAVGGSCVVDDLHVYEMDSALIREKDSLDHK